VSLSKVFSLIHLSRSHKLFFLVLVPEIENLDLPNEPQKATDEDSKDVKMQILSKLVEEEKLALKALDGFLLVLSDEGEITYVSENIADILGLSKVGNQEGEKDN
jgi:hypothetical protein